MLWHRYSDTTSYIQYTTCCMKKLTLKLLRSAVPVSAVTTNSSLLSLNYDRPQANAGIGIPDKLNPCLLKGTPDFLDCLEMRADGSPLKSFQPADCGNCDPGLKREPALLPSKERSRRLNLTRDHKHLPLDPLRLIGRIDSGVGIGHAATESSSISVDE
jgi:hypothetical protein